MTMMNDDDSFIREVNEELRSEQIQTVWKRFRPFIIGGAVLIVLGVSGASAFQWWQARESSLSGDRFLSALKDVDEKRDDEAAKQLEALSKDGFGAYPVLAKIRLATLKADKGDAKSAIADFEAIGADTSVPVAVRNAVKLRAAWLLVDNGTYDEVAKQVEELATPASAMRHGAREALGLAAYKAGDYKKANEWFKLIADDNDAPSGSRTRARIVLESITASGKLS